MKRWKLLLLLAAAGAMLLAANPPYLSRQRGLTVHTMAVDSAGDSTYFHDTIKFKIAGFNYLRYRIIFVATSDSILGAWIEDTLQIRLDFLKNGVWVEQDTSYAADVSGDTLEGLILPAVGDTVLEEWARIIIYFADTVSDTTSSMVFSKTVSLFATKR